MGHSGPKTKRSFPPAPQQDLGPTAWHHTGGSRAHPSREWPGTQATQEETAKGKLKLPGMPSERQRNLEHRNVREQNYSKKRSHRDPTRQTQNEPQYGRDVGGGGRPVDPMGVKKGARKYKRVRGTAVCPAPRNIGPQTTPMLCQAPCGLQGTPTMLQEEEGTVLRPQCQADIISSASQPARDKGPLTHGPNAPPHLEEPEGPRGHASPGQMLGGGGRLVHTSTAPSQVPAP